MTQRDLAAALGYSDSLISSLETGQRQPDPEMVHTYFIPALGLQDDPRSAAHLLECAAIARGERPPMMRHLPSAPKPRQADRPRAVHRLPALPIELIGRNEIVQQLSNRLLGHGGRLLTLVGPPGVGKTTLALAVATQVQQHYPDGAHFIPLAAINDWTLMAATIIATVAPGDSSNKPPQTRAIELLRPQATLLVLDNLEQIAGAASLIATLLAECPTLTILATSRERLHLRAEQRFKVPPLDLNAAVELFVQRAQAVDDSFCLTDENRSAIAAICTRLDCLPLALELCAAQIELFAPAQLLAQLQARPLDLLVDGAHDLPPQHRTLRQAIQRSYALLKPDEQLLFRYLGVFAGGFDLAAAEAISNLQQPSDILLSLIGKSLVRAEALAEGTQRFSLLETIREFALEQLRAHDEVDILQQRHYAVYLQFFRTGDSHLRGAETTIWFARLSHDHDNLRAALQWTFNEKRYADAAWLLIAVYWFWHLQGNWYEKGRWLAQLIHHRQTLESDLRLAVLANVYSAARTWEEFLPLERYTVEMMQLLEICSNKLLQAVAWFWLAFSSTDFAQAATAWEQAIGSARAAAVAPKLGAEFCLLADYDFVLVTCLWDYAIALIERGQISQATPLVTECLEILQRRENRYEIADGIGTLGILALLQGDLEQAHRYFTEAVTLATAFNCQWMLGNWQPLLGIVTLYEGDVAEARQLLNDSWRLCVELKDKYCLSRVCSYLAQLALWEGDLVAAEQWLAQSVAYYADLHRITIYEIERLWVAARLATAQLQYLRAAILFGIAEQTHSQIHHVIGGLIHSLADGALATVQAALSSSAFDEAFAYGQQILLPDAIAAMLVQESL